jgi:hypothetical protein
MAAKLGVRLPSMWAAKSKPDVSMISDLVTEGLLTDIARDERAKMGDAFRQEYGRSTAPTTTSLFFTLMHSRTR